MREEEAARRMRSLNDILEQNGEQWTSSTARISVSSGVSGFGSLKDLADAIERADQAMYEGRQRARRSSKSRDLVLAS